MKRILIYYETDKLKPIGGPAGYLSNVFDLLENYEDEQLLIEFLPKRDFVNLGERKNKFISVLKFLNKRIPIYTFLRLFLSKGDSIINSYDVVHFHDTFSLYKNRKRLYGKIVILQSHSPIPAHIESFGDSQNKIYSILLQFFFGSVDIYSFSRGDYFIFPTEYSFEGYLKNNRLKKLLFESSKIRIIPTGIKDTHQHLSASFHHSISNNFRNIVFGYMGRHIEVKGYDRFVNIFSNLVVTNPRVSVAVAGEINNKINFPVHPKWKEMGWMSSNDFFRGIDVLVVPNRETYFDLIVLEALSHAKVVILSSTGGNKHFLKFINLLGKSIYFFESDNELEKIVIELSKVSLTSLIEKGDLNRKLFLDNFTANKLVDHYVSFLRTL